MDRNYTRLFNTWGILVLLLVIFSLGCLINPFTICYVNLKGLLIAQLRHPIFCNLCLLFFYQEPQTSKLPQQNLSDLISDASIDFSVYQILVIQF